MNDADKRIQVVVGEPLSRDILSMDGAMVLAAKGTMVTQDMLRRLANWIVEEDPRQPSEIRERKPASNKMRDEIIKKLEFDDIVSQKTRENIEKGIGGFFQQIGDSKNNISISHIENSIAELVDGAPDHPDVPLKLMQLRTHSSYLFQHSIECGIIGSFIASSLNYTQREISSFSLAMMIHDTGVLSIPESIVNKPGKLSQDETLLIQGHPVEGWNKIKRIPGIDPIALMIAIGHHISADGTGYPDTVDFNDLPSLVHLASIIDHFEALTSERPFRPAFALHDAIKVILSQRDKYHPAAIENFISVVGIFPISTFVQLSSGEVGVVTRNNQENLFLPEVKLVLDPTGKQYSKEILVNLLTDTYRHIVAALNNI
ncbi:MAG TPA: HD domain-containing protein [bacterium]|nr:HD domain-containing protein [bacterium]